jgi:glycosyltransferase involved in cell wall biosynthesis
MKILLLHQYFNTPNDSGSTRAYEFCKRLAKKGYDVTVITSSRKENNNSFKWYFKKVENINVHYLPNKYDNKFNFYSRIFSFLRFSFLSIFKILKFEYDIIIATSTPLTIAIPVLFLLNFKKRKFIFEVRDLWPEMPIAVGAIKNKFLIKVLKIFEKKVYTAASKIICLSPGMKRGVIKSNIEPKKTVIIPNSCDFEIFNEKNKNYSELDQKYNYLFNSKTILYAGALGKLNGVNYLIEIAKYFKNQKIIKFLIVGDGSEKKIIKDNAIKSSLLNKNIFIFDKLKKREIVYFFDKCTISSSLFIDMREMWSNSANKYFDTMAAKKPIMINYLGWHASLINRYNTGFIIPPSKPEEAAKIIQKIIGNEKNIIEMGKNNYYLGKKFFDRDILYEKFHKTIFE